MFLQEFSSDDNYSTAKYVLSYRVVSELAKTENVDGYFKGWKTLREGVNSFLYSGSPNFYKENAALKAK